MARAGAKRCLVSTMAEASGRIKAYSLPVSQKTLLVAVYLVVSEGHSEG